MQPKSKILDFKSDLAPWLYAFFEEKYRLGYKYTGIDTNLMSFDKFLMDKDCKKSLSKEIILQWVERKPHQKTETVRHNIKVMRALADFLSRNNFPAYKVPDVLVPRKEYDFTPYIFTYDEIDRIIDEFDNIKRNNISPHRYLVYPLLIRVLCFCGLRISEALDLKLKDIDFENGVIMLRKTKNCQDRLIPINNTLKERFCAYRDKMNFITAEDYFFRAPDGFRYSICTIETTFRKAMFAAGIPYRGRNKGPRLHDLRHTFCVHSLRKLTANGQDPYAVMPILMTYLGHKSIGATSKYIHLSPESYPELVKQTEKCYGELIPLEDNSNEATN